MLKLSSDENRPFDEESFLLDAIYSLTQDYYTAEADGLVTTGSHVVTDEILRVERDDDGDLSSADVLEEFTDEVSRSVIIAALAKYAAEYPGQEIRWVERRVIDVAHFVPQEVVEAYQKVSSLG